MEDIAFIKRKCESGFLYLSDYTFCIITSYSSEVLGS